MAKLDSGFNVVIHALPGLTQGELKQVLATVKRLLKPDAPAAAASPLYSALQTVAGSKMPLNKLKLGLTWELGEARTLQFVQETWGDLKRVQLMGVLSFLAGLEADWLRELKVPVTPTTLVKNLHKIPQIFDQSFPDYRQTGLAPMVLQAMVKK